MLVTTLGMVMLASPLQLENALSPMLVTLYCTPLYSKVSGITTVPEYLLGLLVTSATLPLGITL
jgi:hypothetical protein